MPACIPTRGIHTWPDYPRTIPVKKYGVKENEETYALGSNSISCDLDFNQFKILVAPSNPTTRAVPCLSGTLANIKHVATWHFYQGVPQLVDVDEGIYILKRRA